jgi:hypothetical protein
MKIKINATQVSRTYPYIGIGNVSKAIVLFIEPNKAAILQPGSRYVCYGTIMTVDEESFKPFMGTVTLEND